jgi:HlyD family secretion protein
LIVVSIVLVFLIYQRQKANILPAGVIYSSGTVEANAVTVSAQTMGRVVAKHVRKGDRVRAGDTLLLIERNLLDAKQNELAASLAATRAELEAARIDLANGRKNVERLRDAFKVGSIPQRDFDNASSAYESGSKRVASLESRLQLLQTQQQTLDIQFGYTAVTAPTSGYIQSNPAEVGEIALFGGALFEIVDLNDVWIEIYVNELDIPRVNLNDTAEIHLDSDPNQTVKGVISFISQQAEFTPKNVQTKKERVKQVFAVRVRVDNRSQQFKPGLPVDVYLKK